MTLSYREFLATKRRAWQGNGLEVDSLPNQLFDWQAAIVRWALRKGCAAIFADCGLGKTFMQVAWAHATGRRTLILAPLCVAEQTVQEAAKLGIAVHYAPDHDHIGHAPIIVTNYGSGSVSKIADPNGAVRSVPEWAMPKRSSKPKGQGTEHDFTVVARRVVEQAIGERLDGSPLINKDAGKNPAAVALGKLGGPKGGHARAAKLTPKQRRDIAKKGAAARWKKD